jgi:hypothetical protein
MANSSSILNPRIYEDHSSFTEHVTFQKNVTISGLLTVEGDITTIKSTTLEVDDINITLGRTANATNVTAEGGGITLKGATDKTIIWESEHDAWVFSENINLASTKQLLVDGSAVYATLASPDFTGSVTAPTVAISDNSAKVATTAAVKAVTDFLAPKANPTFTGSVTAPTVAINDSTNVATNAAVKAVTDLLAPKLDPAFTGSVTAPTVAINDSTNVATNAAVKAVTDLLAPKANPTFTGTVNATNATLNAATVVISDNSTKVATTAAVKTVTDTLAPKDNPTFSGTVNASDLVLSGNLTVNGSTTTIKSTTLEVDDKNITLGITSNPTDVGADGGGITLKGATDKTLNWNNASKSWASSENINLASGKQLLVNGSAMYAPLASPSFSGTVSGITKGMVGLVNVDNTSDADKPVSTAQQEALDLKAPLESPSFSGTVSGITKGMVGLVNVDNTSDADKPVSTAQQEALNLKAPKLNPAFTGVISLGGTSSLKIKEDLWTQLGVDIDGESLDDASGRSVSLSNDGNTVAIGAPRNDGSGSNAGQVRVYDWNKPSSPNLWTQRGLDIDGEAAGDLSGTSVSLSGDGNTVAIGAYGNDGATGSNSGHVRVYVWNTPSSPNAWTQRGLDIDGEAAGDNSGISVSLSYNGNTVAIGAQHNTGTGGLYCGQVRVYDWNTPSSPNLWTQRGADIDGETTGDQSGTSVSISGDGDTVAIGSYVNDGATGSNSGHVRVYVWNTPSSPNAWTQRGLDIDGEAAGDLSGISISLSKDGNTVAIGAQDNTGTGGPYCGQVRVYDWDTPSSPNLWTQRGVDIDGEATGDGALMSVSLSGDGSTVAISSPINIGTGLENSGKVRVYEWNVATTAWTKRGLDINGEGAGDFIGTSVSLSYDGSILAVGSEKIGSNRGQVRIYKYINPQLVLRSELGYLSGVTSNIQTQLTAKAPLASPAFTGSVTAPTVAINDSTNVATNAAVKAVTDLLAPKLDPAFTGSVTAPTVAISDNSTKVATTAAVKAVTDLLAPKLDPAFTGSVTAPTVAINDSTNVATNAAVKAVTDLLAPKLDPSFTGTVYASDLILSGILTVNGSTTTINSTTLEVDDKNITLGITSNPTDVGAEGGGITLKGETDKTIIWESEHDAWVFSENINLASGKQLLVDGSAVYATLASPTFSGTVNATGATLNASTLTASTVAIDDSTNVATNAAVKEAIDDLRDMINVLYARLVIDLITAQNWSAARTAYNGLNSTQQALVTNYQTLVDGEAATIVINLITSQNWSAARTAYNGLNSAQQALVTNYQTLVDGENTMVQNVIDLITSQNFSAARIYYDQLPSALRASVTNYQELVDAENSMVQTVINLITSQNWSAARTAYDGLNSALRASVTNYQELVDGEAAEIVINLIASQNWSAARTAYNGLNSAQQALVTNYQTLVDGEAATIVINLITSQNWSAARSAYDGLNSAQQALVTNYQELVDAEAGQ